jgi:DNA helicase-2/ATP-dependent DNA helicase PcrA
MASETFIADLHLHSKYSRATARNLDLENIYIWAQLKGITLVGTGDFTHPDWFDQIKAKLEPAEPGLYRLKSEIATACDEIVPYSCRSHVRFMLNCEISNIYKKDGHTRKNHNLVFFPDLKDVQRINSRLDAIGNIKSDGRPILGLDAHDLLEIVLETSDEGFLVPAHIWTPWFSMLGSKSGFDSIEACFGDLSSHIFAAETGLSSDPAMNWRVADLDRITLISNSDAHSPSKLGREANLFNTEMSYAAVRKAIETGDKNFFPGTFEFYPEEGKYHVDGHRKCEICFSPAETRSHSGICPVCGKALTLGVLHRVEALATRPKGYRPKHGLPFYKLIPLDDLLAEILRVGPQSKKVKQTYHMLLEKLGCEINILHYFDRKTIESADIPLLGEAIDRMRNHQVSFSPGYDGLFGSVRIFSDGERESILGQQKLFMGFDRSIEKAEIKNHRKADIKNIDAPAISDTQVINERESSSKSAVILNQQQLTAVNHSQGPIMIVAGPGTGKTRTLTQRIARLIEQGVNVDHLLAVTFTNKAAGEMRERLAAILGETQQQPFVGTFHAIGFKILSAYMGDNPLMVVDEEIRNALLSDVMKLVGRSKIGKTITRDNLLGWIVGAKQKILSTEAVNAQVCPPEHLDDFRRCYEVYEHLLKMHGLVDFEDLIFRAICLLQDNTAVQDQYSGRFSHILIDEYQDINAGQYRLIRLLAGDYRNLCIIGDPDQSIYGFRGSDPDCFQWFLQDFPDSRIVFLENNYRSVQTILDVSVQVIQKNNETIENIRRKPVFSGLRGDPYIHIMALPTENAEAVAIGKTIETMMGGTGFFSLDSGAVDSTIDVTPLSFGDFAVLFRTRGQGRTILRVLEKAGIPCQTVDRKSVLDHNGIQSLLSAVKMVYGMGLFDDLQATAKLLNAPLSATCMDLIKKWSYKNEMSLSETMLQAKRLPIPGMGRQHQQKLYDFIGRLFDLRKRIDGMPLKDAIDWIRINTGLDERYQGDNRFETGMSLLRQRVNDHVTEIREILTANAISVDTDIYDHRVEKVALLTMHAAKGLEFPVVFIAGCEDDWIPYRSASRNVDLEEERRLFYVALTRARKHLFLTKAATRIINGQKHSRRPSPFIKDIENKYKRLCGQEFSKPNAPTHVQLSLFGTSKVR